MPSRNTDHLTWVSLTLDVGYLVMAAPAKHSRRAERSYCTFKVRRGGSEEIPLIQGKEQWLHFAGAAVRRYPTPKVRETQVRLKPYSQKTSQSNHTRTTALSNSMKLSHAVWGHPRREGHGGEV